MHQAAQQIVEAARLWDFFLPEEMAEVNHILTVCLPLWVPLPGPQTEAFYSEADILFYGGSAGGGKSDLLLGLSVTEHAESIIFRREAKQLLGLQNRLLDNIIKSRKNWNGQDDILRHPGHQVEFGSCKVAGDELKYQGRPHDLVGFDEITHFLEAQFRFLMGWNRTTRMGQRCRVVCTGNPPTNADGQWVTEYWGPWLDKNHPNPAKPGELRFYAVIDKKDVAVEDGTPFHYKGELIRPLSRTFIPSFVQDNPYLMETGYEATLQSLPEPLRSMMLKGDFGAGKEDHPWQVFPTEWVEAAMNRWEPLGLKAGPMDSIGLDVAMGGNDKTSMARRHGSWYDILRTWPGKMTTTGSITTGLVVPLARDGAPFHVDAIGVGGQTVGHLQSLGVQVIAVQGNSTKEVENQFDKASKTLRFRNFRSMLHWRFRESLDPDNHEDIALPPDPELKADLCAVRWKLTPGGILIEEKEEIKTRIGRSPDKGDSVIYASIATEKQADGFTAAKANELYEQYGRPVGGV